MGLAIAIFLVVWFGPILLALPTMFSGGSGPMVFAIGWAGLGWIPAIGVAFAVS